VAIDESSGKIWEQEVTFRLPAAYGARKGRALLESGSFGATFYPRRLITELTGDMLLEASLGDFVEDWQDVAKSFLGGAVPKDEAHTIGEAVLHALRPNGVRDGAQLRMLARMYRAQKCLVAADICDAIAEVW